MSTLSIHHAKVLYQGTLQPLDITTENGIITQMKPTLPKGEESIDATGYVVLPGCIDVHVHFRVPGAEYKEDWESGSNAALHGGVTTVLDMPNNTPGITTMEAVYRKKDLVRKMAKVNFGLFLGATKDNTEEIRKAAGIPGVKVYMGSSTGDLLVDTPHAWKEIFRACKEQGLVTAVHAECEEMILEGEQLHQREEGIQLHNEIRSPDVAERAVRDAVQLQKEIGNKLHVCHCSTQGELKQIQQAKEQGEGISVEVCPHHLLLDTSLCKSIGTFSRVNPPIREAKDREAVYRYLQEGKIDCIATDHAPHTKEEKEQPYWKAPSGMPGIETMLPLLLNEAAEGRISLPQIGRWCAENPARVYGIGKRGALEPGNVADMVIVDPNKEWTIHGTNLFSKAKWSAFDGRKVKGEVQYTIVNGALGFEQGDVRDSKGEDIFRVQGEE